MICRRICNSMGRDGFVPCRIVGFVLPVKSTVLSRNFSIAHQVIELSEVPVRSHIFRIFHERLLEPGIRLFEPSILAFSIFTASESEVNRSQFIEKPHISGEIEASVSRVGVSCLDQSRQRFQRFLVVPIFAIDPSSEPVEGPGQSSRGVPSCIRKRTGRIVDSSGTNHGTSEVDMTICMSQVNNLVKGLTCRDQFTSHGTHSTFSQ